MTEVQDLGSQTKNNSLAKRYNLFPIRDLAAYEAYVKLESTFWTAYELKYTDDKKDYNLIKEYDSTGNNKKMKRLIDYFLGFVLPADGLICENIIDNFLKTAKTYEEVIFFSCQIHNETIHSITYGLVAQTLIPELQDQIRVFEMVDNLPCHKAKMQLMEKYKSGDWSLAERYVAFACAEGIFFTILFNIVFWFKSKNMFKNLIDANRMINRDEARHRCFGCDRFKRIQNGELGHPKITNDRALEIVKEFVEVEKMFVEEMVPEPVEDLTKESLVNYLYNIADGLLIDLGLERYYHSDYAPEWLDISLQQKENFFEVLSVGYNRFSVSDALNINKLTGAIDNNNSNSLNNPEDVDF